MASTMDCSTGGGDSDDPRIAQLEWLQKSCAARMRKDAEELQQLEAQIAAMRPALCLLYTSPSPRDS